MIYGNISYATLTGGGTGGNAYEVRFGYQVLSEDIPNNSRQVKLQLEVRSVKSAYGTYGFTQTSTIDGTTLSGATFDMRNTNVWQTFGSRTITITGAYNGTKSGSFVTDATISSGNYTLKSGSASVYISLTALHRPPEIGTATMIETNQVLTSLGIPDSTIVQYLSQKTITLNVTTYDSATPSYKLEHLGTDYIIPSSGYQSSNVFNTDYTANNFTIDNNGKARILQRIQDSMGSGASDWLKVLINGTASQPNTIAYTKPNLINTSTNIKRKSGNGTVLTDNKVVLNLVGTFYKNNDLVGNNNSITEIGYKIWQTTEPSNYTSLTPTISGGNITITDLEISNVIYTKTYNYKIIVTDNYGYSYIQEGTIPTGISVWTEYKDRVDFYRLTVGGYNPFEYSDEETIVGIWEDGKPIYRKVFIGEATAERAIYINLSNMNVDVLVQAYGWVKAIYNNWWPLNNHYGLEPNYDTSMLINANFDFSVDLGSYFSYPDYRIVLEYTKTTD